MKRGSSLITSGLLIAIVSSGGADASAQTGTVGGEWATYAGDLGSTRYAPLDQINGANFSDLQVAWRFNPGNLGPYPDNNYQATPLMIDGVLYTTAGSRRNVVALDADTGEILWMYRINEGERAEGAIRRMSGRGVAYWTDGQGDERIFFVTIGYQLVALDARTGRPIPSFGRGGIVDLKQDADQEIDLLSGEIGWNSAPIVGRDVVLVGASHRSGGAPPSRRNVKGYIRGFDVRTGDRKWIFHTVPHPDELGYETWRDGSAEYTGNTGVWTTFSVDEEFGIAYLPIEIPTGGLLRWSPARRKPVRREPRGRGPRDGRAALALPVRPPPALGLRRARAAHSGGHHRGRTGDQGRGAANQAGLGVRLRSRHR